MVLNQIPNKSCTLSKSLPLVMDTSCVKGDCISTFNIHDCVVPPIGVVVGIFGVWGISRSACSYSLRAHLHKMEWWGISLGVVLPWNSHHAFQMEGVCTYSPTHCSIAGNHPGQPLLGFSAALAPKFPPCRFHSDRSPYRLPAGYQRATNRTGLAVSGCSSS